MATTHFKGPVVVGPAGTAATVSGNGLQVVSGNVQVDSGSVKIGSTTMSETELGFLDGVSAGTATASKAVVLGASKEIATITTATITNLTNTNLTTAALTLGATALGSTATEIDARCDDSAMVDTRTGAGAISVTTAYTALVTTGADTITLAAPSKPAFTKVIKMTTDGGDGTLAMTNIINALGAETTSITFNDVNDVIVLVSDAASGKWILIANDGCTLA